MDASRQFYEKLGFEMMGGDESSWLILKNGESTVGLFHGLFEGNILTFNPGWNTAAEELDDFTDIRQIRSHLVDQGVELGDDTTQDSPSGPASLTLVDPDGNAILIDQHR